jgi:hypothetical protein
MSKKYILITGCCDPMRWYSGLVGRKVPFVRDTGDGWASIDRGGYVNLVQYEDGVLIVAGD